MNRIEIIKNMKKLWEDISDVYKLDGDVSMVMDRYTDADTKAMATALVWSGILGEHEDGNLEPICLDACIKEDYEEILYEGICQIYEIGIHTCGWTWEDLEGYLVDSMWDENTYWKNMIAEWRK